MHEFENIRITHGPSIELLVDNPTELKLVDKGAHGAVFRLPGDKCVKIYADEEVALMEAQAYKRAKSSDSIPKLYESGNNFIIMEYVDGISLLQLLSQNKELTPDISAKLIMLFREMQRICFTRIDTSLRHVIMDQSGALKVVDIVYSYHVLQAYPKRAFIDLKERGLLLTFLKHLGETDPEIYGEWITLVPATLLERGVGHE